MTPANTRAGAFTSRLVTVAALLGVLAAPTVASAASEPSGCGYRDYRRQPNEGSWNAADINYYVIASSFPRTIPNRNGATYDPLRIRNRVISGARTWNRVRTHCNVRRGPGPRITFRYAGSSGSTATSWTDSRSTVDFRAPVAISGNRSYLLDSQNCVTSGTILGCEHTETTGPSGQTIIATDISFNNQVPWWTGVRPIPSDRTDSYDLWTVAAHEMGHSLGIAHPVNSASGSDSAALKQQVMYPNTPPNTLRRYLAGGELSALCTIYGC